MVKVFIKDIELLSQKDPIYDLSGKAHGFNRGMKTTL